MRKMLKKIAAIAAGASMLGATLLGAAAADLSDYPAPFVTDGKFNAVLVIGAKAQPIDNIGVTNIATSLQYVSTTAVSGSTEVSISEGVKIEKTGDDLNYFETLNDIQATPLDDSDLPTVLADGTYEDNEGDNENDVTYTQTLALLAGTGTLDFVQPKDMDAGAYLVFTEDDNVYNFTLEFDDVVEFDSADATDDLGSTTLELQGQTYTITKAAVTGAALTKLTMLAGETTRWLTQAEPFTVMQEGKSYTVTVVDVSEDETKCGIDVDGQVMWIDVDQTKSFGALDIGVTDAVAIHEEAQNKDICEVNIGATELVLENGQQVVVNGVEVDGSVVGITGDDDEWYGLNVVFGPDSDDVNLKPSEAYTDPVMGNFKFLFAGMTESMEKVELKTSGSSDAALTFPNNDGKEVEVPMFLNETKIWDIQLGNDVDERLLMDGESYEASTGVEGTMFFFVTTGGETHILSIENVDETDDKVDIKDLTYGTTYNDKDYTDGGWTDVALGSLGTAELYLEEVVAGKVTYIEIGDNMLCTADNCVGTESLLTNNGMSINFTVSGVGNLTTVSFRGNQDGDIDDVAVDVDLSYDPDDEDINIMTPAGVDLVDISEDNSDTKLGVTDKGTKYTYDDENKDSLVIDHPDGDVKGNVFVAPIAGEAVTSSTGSVVVNKIDVGSTKFDSEVDSVSAQNVIAVGGPCVNTVSADLLGNPADCTAGFEVGKAMVKLFANGDNVALLVAGFTGEDTRAASKVMANYEDYDLSGMEVEVTTATETVTKVG